MRESQLGGSGGLLYVGEGQLPLHTDDAAALQRRPVRGCSASEAAKLCGQLLDVHGKRIVVEDVPDEGVRWCPVVRLSRRVEGGLFPPHRHTPATGHASTTSPGLAGTSRATATASSRPAHSMT